jgi:toxin ParE1/3/4
MPHTVMLLENAGKDLMALYRYLNRAAGKTIAIKEIEFLEKACDSLSENPERGNVPRELERTGIFEYRQIIAKSYRIIYQIIENNVFIFGIIHGRRNVQEILRQRIFMK